MSFTVKITKTAYTEIARAHQWLLDRSEPAAARWQASLLKAIDKLADNPDRYPLAPESEWYPGPLRQMLIGKRRATYRILFERAADTVFILRVRHSAQELIRPQNPREQS
jgi:plasmid stabilization system protein ParE